LLLFQVIFQKAHKIAKEHGFLSIESRVCCGLGEISWRGYRDLEPLQHKNSCRRTAVVNYEAILLLRNAVTAGTLAEIDSRELQVNAFYNLAHALFNCTGRCDCPKCLPSNNAWGITPSLAVRELEHVEMELSQAVSAVDDLATQGVAPWEVAVLRSFTFVADHLKNRELLSPSIPNRAMLNLKHRFVRVLLHIRQGWDEAAEVDVMHLLRYITVISCFVVCCGTHSDLSLQPELCLTCFCFSCFFYPSYTAACLGCRSTCIAYTYHFPCAHRFSPLPRLLSHDRRSRLFVVNRCRF
jgi:hypothetical protein